MVLSRFDKPIFLNTIYYWYYPPNDRTRPRNHTKRYSSMKQYLIAKCMVCGEPYELHMADKEARGFHDQWCRDIWFTEYSSKPKIKELLASKV